MQSNKSFSFIFTFLISFCFSFVSPRTISAQISSSSNLIGEDLNAIQTAVPFLTISPDARSGGLGEVGVASNTDINSQNWNAAKYPFAENGSGVSISYSPWLRSLIPDINLLYLSGYYRIDSTQVISSSFRFFSLGSITFTDYNGTVTGQYHPIEFAYDVGYSRMLADNLSGGIVLRFIYSNLTNGQSTAVGTKTKIGTSFAADLGFLYRKAFSIRNRNALWAAGLNLSNLGTPISYTADAEKTPIPSNLRIGVMGQIDINEDHSVSIMADLNKLLVPTPPVYLTDTVTGNTYLAYGMEPPNSVISGMLHSFYDAPGYVRSDGSRSVLLEEIYEITAGFGAEYLYKNLVALRVGYFHQHQSKGNYKYITIGAGLSLSIFTINCAYMIPTNDQESPLSSTFRITLSASFNRRNN